jgi:hypothetical protein
MIRRRSRLQRKAIGAAKPVAGMAWLRALVGGSGWISSIKCEGEMRMRSLMASLVVLGVLYFWDKNYNDGRFLEGLAAMRRDMAHNMFN